MTPSIASIQRATCDVYAISLNDLLSDRRARDVVYPRQIAMYLARELTTASFPVIGRHFGNRDHSTVMHAVKAVDRRVREGLVSGRLRSIRAQIHSDSAGDGVSGD